MGTIEGRSHTKLSVGKRGERVRGTGGGNAWRRESGFTE